VVFLEPFVNCLCQLAEILTLRVIRFVLADRNVGAGGFRNAHTAPDVAHELQACIINRLYRVGVKPNTDVKEREANTYQP
jgi:hypothetical protein